RAGRMVSLLPLLQHLEGFVQQGMGRLASGAGQRSQDAFLCGRECKRCRFHGWTMARNVAIRNDGRMQGASARSHAAWAGGSCEPQGSSHSTQTALYVLVSDQAHPG